MEWSLTQKNPDTLQIAPYPDTPIPDTCGYSSFVTF